MFAVISRSEPIPRRPPEATAPGPAGAAEIGFAVGPGGTQLRHLFQASPLRVCLPRPEPDDLPTAVLVNTGGGVVGGDTLRIAVAAGPGSRALVTTQAAEKIYRSAGPDARIATRLSVEAGAWLEWLPQETILFDASRLRRSLDIEVARGGRCLAGEILVFGRRASGERYARGLLHDAWRVRRQGRLAWTDALRLERDIPALLAAPAGFAGAAAYATLAYVGDDAPGRLEAARALLDGCRSRAGATLVNGLLLLRLLGDTAEALRQDFAALWAGLRAALAGLPPRLPRLWRT